MIVGYTLLTPEARPPSKTFAADAGWDVYASEDRVLRARNGYQIAVSTGLALFIPPGFYGQFQDRSGLALVGVMVLGGVIDSGYQGEAKVILACIGAGDLYIHRGERIAQLLILPVMDVTWEHQEALAPTERGACGFGSSGK